MHRVICGGPNPEKRPDCMKGEETDPPARVNGILVGVIPRLGHVIGDIVNRDHPVGEGQHDEDEDGECEIAQKVHGGQLLSARRCGVEGALIWTGVLIIVFPLIFTWRKIRIPSGQVI